MKRISRTIAMILVLIMLASSFTSCTFMLPMIFDPSTTLGEWGLRILGAIIDIVIIGLTINALTEAPNEAETQIYLASVEYDPLTQYYSLLEIFNSFPETEKAVLMDRLNSMPTEKRISLIRTISSLPQTEIDSSIERVSSLSEAELASMLQYINALSKAEFDLLTDKLNERANSLPKTDYVASEQAAAPPGAIGVNSAWTSKVGGGSLGRSRNESCQSKHWVYWKLCA